MATIKRYPNRKLYDTEAKRYVTLDHIADMIQSGEELTVVDHETGEDLTTVTLSQIIFEQEKKRAGFLPKSILANLIRTGSDTLDYLWRSFHTSIGALRIMEQEINRRLDALVERGEIDAPEANRMRAELARTSLFRLDTRIIEDQVEGALHRLNLPTQSEIRELEAQIELINQRLQEVVTAQTGSDGKAADGSEAGELPTAT